MNNPHIVLIDNQDSFVYNLVDAFAEAGYRTTVFRNTVPVEHVLAVDPDLICLSPGPGHPRQAGTMMELVSACLGRIPVLGICLGFQALLEHHGGTVEPCGPVHGVSLPMRLVGEGIDHPVFACLTVDAGPARPELGDKHGHLVPVARYHSLGCANVPEGMRALAVTETDLGDVVMAAETFDGQAIGLQFHPESVLSPQGPVILARCVNQLLKNSTIGKVQ